MYELGVSSMPIRIKKISGEKLAKAIEEVIGTEKMYQKAEDLGRAVRSEDGAAIAVEWLSQYLVDTVR